MTEEESLKKAVEIAQRKLAELTTDKVITFRFMPYEEFEKIARGNKIKKVNTPNSAQIYAKFDEFMELPLKKKTDSTGRIFENVEKKDIAAGWSAFAHVLTEWAYSAGAPKNYDTLQKKYVELLKTHKNKKQALIELRNQIIFLFVNCPECKNIDDARKRLREMIQEINRESLNKAAGYKYDIIYPAVLIFKGLYDDPEYFVKNEKNIKEILLKLAVGTDISAGILKYPPNPAYHAVMFFTKDAVKGTCFTLKGYLNSSIGEKEFYWCKLADIDQSQVLGVIITVPSRDLCQKAVAEVIKQAQINPYAAMPVFNWRGTLLYPK